MHINQENTMPYPASKITILCIQHRKECASIMNKDL